MKLQITTILISLWFLGIGCNANKSVLQTAPDQLLKKYTFSELDQQLNTEPRPTAIFLHAPWCKYCRSMEQTTFKNPGIIELLNQHYYFVSFDGEQEEDVIFRNRRYQYANSGPNSGIHQLAFELGNINGDLAYPALVMLNKELEITFQRHSFMSKEELKAVLLAGLNSNTK